MIFQLNSQVEDGDTAISWIEEHVPAHEIVRMVAVKVTHGWLLKAAFTSMEAAELVKQHCEILGGEISQQEAPLATPASESLDQEQTQHLRLIHEMLADLAGVRQKVGMSTSFTEDIGIDSLDLVQLIMALEDECGVTVPDEQYEQLKTVGDAVMFLSENSR